MFPRHKLIAVALLWLASSTEITHAQPARVPDSIRVELDLPYAATDNPRQRLDLFVPKNPKSDKPLPVVAFIHGGGWQNGDKRGGYRMLAPLIESGEYAGVSIGYRLSGESDLAGSNPRLQGSHSLVAGQCQEIQPRPGPHRCHGNFGWRSSGCHARYQCRCFVARREAG